MNGNKLNQIKMAKKKAKTKANIKDKSKTKGERKRRDRKSRIRKDTFSSYTYPENGAFFDGIVNGMNDSYMIDFQAFVKRDYKDRERHCWMVTNKSTGAQVLNLRSAKCYRLATVWSVYTYPEYWRSTKKLRQMKEALPSIEGKRGDHSRHRCGFNWCCNPGHILIGSRRSNERDKHFHYFLNHSNEEVRDTFRTNFKGLCLENGMF